MGCKITCRKFNIKKKRVISKDNASLLNTSQNIIINNQLISNSSSKDFIEQRNKSIIEKGIEELNNFIKNKFKKDELKINLYPNNIPQGKLEKRSVKDLINKNTLYHSFDINQNLAFLGSKVPFLYGLYTAHTSHYPFRIKPDDIWLLIVQAFSNHVNAKSKQLRDYFVNFDGKKKLEVKYYGVFVKENIDKQILEDYSVQINEQMEKYLGKEILQTLTPNFSTSDYNSIIINKITIMGAFKHYFDYHMRACICGIPYIILEGTSEDYEKIKEKAEKLSKYKFEWYINRIIPHIQKMIEAKKGKIDIDYFKNIIKKNTITGIVNTCIQLKGNIDIIDGWILDFFAYDKNLEKFTAQSLKVGDFDDLAEQMLIAPFTIYEELTKKTYNMKYTVGFIGCDQNDKMEVFPVQGYIVS